MRWDRSGEGKEVRGIGQLKMEGVVEVAIEVGLASRVMGAIGVVKIESPVEVGLEAASRVVEGIWVLSKITEGTGVAILELEVDHRAMKVMGAEVERRVMVETGVQG